jgi:hypothetical protein
MHHARFIACTSISLVALLCGCDGLHAPSAEEKGARKIADATARARMLALRIAPSPDAVSASLEEEGGATREVSKPVLAPADAAKELRTLASEISNAGGSEAQKRDARELAARMRRDALLLDLADLERLAQEKSVLVREIEGRVAGITSIMASGDPRADELAAATVKGMRDARDRYRRELASQGERTDAARTRLKPIEDTITEKRREAEALDATVGELRAEAMTRTAARAGPRMEAARVKLNAAQDLRVAAAEAEREAEPLRSEVRVGEAGLAGADETDRFLAQRMKEADDAADGAKARADGARERIGALGQEAAALTQQFMTLEAEKYQPVAKAVSEALEANDLAGKNPTDAASVALLKARFAAISIDAIGQAAQLAMVAAAAGGQAPDVSAIAAARDAELGKAKAALVEAREALKGTESSAGRSMMASVNQLAAALGIELPAGPAMAAESTDAAPPAEDAPAPDAPAPDAPAPDAPAPDAPAPDAPAPDAPAPDAPAPDAPAPDAPAPDAPAPDAPAPDAPPEGDPAPSDPPADEPAPPPAEPSDPNEPNK